MKRDKEEGLFESMAPWGGRGCRGRKGGYMDGGVTGPTILTSS